jgi:dihydroneopterin aldolase
MSEITYTIALKGIKLHAPIGYFDWERVQLNYFEVDMEVTLVSNSGSVQDQLEKTVDYGTLHSIVLQQSKIPVALLETYCETVWQQILEQYPTQIKSGWIRLSKLQPPLPGRVDRSSVTLNYHR